MPTIRANKPAMPALEFVNINKPEEIYDPEKQSTIRRKARQRDGKKGSRAQQASNVVTDVTRLRRYTVTERLLLGTFVHSDVEMHTKSYPSVDFPIQMNLRTFEIVNFVKQGGDGNYCPLMNMWWNMGLLDSTAFLITLANASRLLDQRAYFERRESLEAMTYYTKSLRTLQKRLGNPVDRISDGVLVAAMQFAYYDFVSRNFSRWLVHLNGVKELIRRRGGIQTLQSSHTMLLLMFWIDVSGSFIFDKTPYFPPPIHLLRPFKPLDYMSRREMRIFADSAEFGMFLRDAAYIAKHIDNHATDFHFWKDDAFISRTFNVTVHQLLSLPRHNEEPQESKVSSQELIREAFRRACMILFSLLRKRFSVTPSGGREHKSKVKDFFKHHDIDWTGVLELRLWVLATAALAADSEEIQWYIGEISGTMTQMGLLAWEDVLGIVRQILWMDETFKVQVTTLKESFDLFESNY